MTENVADFACERDVVLVFVLERFVRLRGRYGYPPDRLTAGRTG